MIIFVPFPIFISCCRFWSKTEFQIHGRITTSLQPVPEAWSPDAAKIAEAAAAAAARAGGLGVGPRVPLDDAYGIFRVLNLTERGITTVSSRITEYFSLPKR